LKIKTQEVQCLNWYRAVIIADAMAPNYMLASVLFNDMKYRLFWGYQTPIIQIIDNMSTVSTGLIYKQYRQSKHYSMMYIRVRPTYTRNSL